METLTSDCEIKFKLQGIISRVWLQTPFDFEWEYKKRDDSFNNSKMIIALIFFIIYNFKLWQIQDDLMNFKGMYVS